MLSAPFAGSRKLTAEERYACGKWWLGVWDGVKSEEEGSRELLRWCYGRQRPTCLLNVSPTWDSAHFSNFHTFTIRLVHWFRKKQGNKHILANSPHMLFQSKNTEYNSSQRPNKARFDWLSDYSKRPMVLERPQRPCRSPVTHMGRTVLLLLLLSVAYDPFLRVSHTLHSIWKLLISIFIHI